MLQKFTRVAAATAVAVVANFGLAQAEGLKLGALIPLTGGLQVYGEVSVQGVNIAVDQANAAGGVNGGKVEVITADTQANGTAAFDAAMILMLAAEKAGSSDRKAILAAIPEVANAPGVPVGPGDFAKAKKLLAEGQDIDYVGASGPQNFDANGDTEGATYAHWVIKNGAYENVKIFSP